MNTILTGELITVDGKERRYPRNHEPLMRWAKASGIDPNTIRSDSMTVNGDTITAEQFVFDAQGKTIPTKDGGGVETTTITRQQAYPIPAPIDPTTPLGTRVELEVSDGGVKVRISGTVTAINHDDNGRTSYTIHTTPVGEGDGHTYISF